MGGPFTTATPARALLSHGGSKENTVITENTVADDHPSLKAPMSTVRL